MVPTLWKASRLVSLSRRVRNTSPRFVDLSWPNRVKRCGILQWRTLNPTTAYPPYPIMLNSACNEWHRILSIYFIYISVYITICIYTYRISLYWYTYSRLFLYAYCIHTYIRVHSWYLSRIRTAIACNELHLLDSPWSVGKTKNFENVSKMILFSDDNNAFLYFWLQVQDHVITFFSVFFSSSTLLDLSILESVSATRNLM